MLANNSTAIPPQPHSFGGTVQDGTGPVGVEVRAEVDGVPYGSLDTMDVGGETLYGYLNVAGDDTDVTEKSGASSGETIIFWVGENITNEVANWAMGETTELNLTYETTGQPASLVINEIMIAPAIGNEWVELYNPTGSPVALDDWSLNSTDDGEVYPSLAGLTVPANGWLAIDLNSTTLLEDDAMDEIMLCWADPAATVAGGNPVVIDRVEYGPAAAGPDDTNNSLGLISNADLPAANESLSLAEDGVDTDDPASDFISHYPTPDGTNLNTPPSISNVRIEPGPADVNYDLDVVYDYSDPETDPESGTQIWWYRNGTLVEEYNDLSTLPASATGLGDEWHVEVRPRDGVSYGALVASDPVTIELLNQPPEARNLQITPSSPTSADTLTATYMFFDPDLDSEGATIIEWRRDGPHLPSYDGLLTIPSNATAVGEVWNVSVQPHDGTDYGDTAYAEVTIMNAPPTIANLTITPESPQTEDALTVEYDYDDPDGDTESGTAIEWYVNGDHEMVHDGATVIPSSATAKGEEWEVHVVVSDGEAFGEEAIESVTIANMPPTASDLALAPAEPTTIDRITISYSYDDVDDDMEAAPQIGWYRDGTLESSYNDAVVLPADATAKGETWRVEVRPYDGDDYGASLNASVTIVNTAPPQPAVDVTPDSPTETDDLICTVTAVDDPDADTITYTYRWYKNDETQAAREETSSALTDTLPAAETADGDSWKCEVTANDGTADSPIGADQVTVGNMAPTTPAVSLAPITANTLTDLVVQVTTPATDADGDTVYYIYNWIRNGMPQPDLEERTTATTAVLDHSETTKHDIWLCRVTPDDGKAYGTSVATSAVTIANSLPTEPTISIAPRSPTAADALECTIETESTDADDDPITYNYKWYLGGDLQADLTTNIVPADRTSDGDIWRCEVTPNDGEADGTTAVDQVAIGNTPPTQPTISLTPETPSTVDALECTITTGSTDPDTGDTVQYIFRWYRDGVAQVDEETTTAQLNDTVAASLTNRAEEWKCRVIPTDGKSYGPYAEATVTVVNTAPSVSNLNLAPEAPTSLDALTITYLYDDPDDDPERGSTIVWRKDGAAQSSFDDRKTLPASETSKGEMWNVTVTPSDGSADGTPVSMEVTIANGAPSVSDVTFTPTEPRTGEDIEVDYTYADPDEDGDQSTIAWTMNGEAQPDYNDVSTLPADATAKGEVWEVTVTPNDGDTTGTALSASVTIVNTPPTVSTVSITPTSPEADERLQVNYTFSDPDGDAESGTTIRWYKNGAVQSSYNNQDSVPATAVSAGDQWNVTVIASDGTDSAAARSSSSVTIVEPTDEGEDGDGVAAGGFLEENLMLLIIIIVVIVVLILVIVLLKRRGKEEEPEQMPPAAPYPGEAEAAAPAYEEEMAEVEEFEVEPEMMEAAEYEPAAPEFAEEPEPEEEMAQCAVCEELIPADAAECPYCGAVFEEEGGEDMARCAVCEELIPADAAECPYCGAVFEEEGGEDMARCAVCEELIPAEAAECPYCGAVFEEPEGEESWDEDEMDEFGDWDEGGFEEEEFAEEEDDLFAFDEDDFEL